MSNKQWGNVKTIIKGSFEYALDKGYIQNNPFTDIKITVKFKQQRKKPASDEVFNSAERMTLIKYLDKQYSQTHDLSFLAIKLNFYLGLRVSELSSLKWKDIQDNNTIHIEREEIRDEAAKKIMVVNHTKTNSDRYVKLVPIALGIIDLVKKSGIIPLPEEYIFKRDGERITSRQLQYVLAKYSERTGVPRNKSSHKIRKTYASNLNAAGVPLDEIRTQLGHTLETTTLGYLFNPLTEEETYQRISEALSV